MHDRSAGSEYPLHRHSANGNALPPARAGEGGQDDEISLQEILNVLRKSKWLILGCFLGVLTLAALYVVLKTPQYRATTSVLVDEQQSTPQLGELMGLSGAQNNIANEVEILKSRTIALGVADRLLDEQNVPGTGERLSILTPPEEEELTRLDVMHRLRNSYVTVQPVGREVDLIDIAVASPQPQEATLVANLYAEEFVAYNRASSRRRVSASREFLSDMTDRFRQELEGAEDTLMTFLTEEEVIAPEAEVQQLLEQIKDLSTRRYVAQLEREAALTKLDDLRAEMRRIAPDLAQQLASGEDLALTRLKRERANLVTELEKKYANNPSLREDSSSQNAQIGRLKRRADALQQEINKRARQLVAEAVQNGGGGVEEMEVAPPVGGSAEDFSNGTSSAAGGASGEQLMSAYGTQTTLGNLNSLQRRMTGLEIEARAQEARLEIIGENLGRYQAELRRIPNKEIVLGRLRRTMDTQEQIYNTLIQQLQEARVAEQSELGYVEVVDEALVPEQPFSPRVLLILVLGSLLGVVLGVGLAFVRNAVDNKVHKPEDLRRRGYSVVGVVPDMKQLVKSDFDGRERITVDGHSYSTRLVALLNPLSPIAENYRRLRTSIQFSRPDTEVQTVMVTSSGPGEGKSVTSMNLALTMAQTGRRTVYVDADLRRSTGHQMMGIAREPGLVDLLFEAYPLGLDRFSTAADNLSVIPAGSTSPNPSELLGSKKMSDFVARLRKEFDVVIIDTPPVLAVTDALLIAPQCDVTVLVASANETPWHALERSTESLREVGTRPAGIVLNRFDPKTAYGSYGYGYGYGYGYNEYYGEKPASQA